MWGVSKVESIRRLDFPFRRLARQRLQRLGEMLAIVEEIDGAGAPGKQKGEERQVRLRRVAGDAGQDQVVRPVVGRFPTPRAHMIERDEIGWGGLPAVGADRPMRFQKPFPVGVIRPPRGAPERCRAAALGG